MSPATPSFPDLTAEQQKLRRDLRATLRQRRRALSPRQQASAAHALDRQLRRLPGLRSARHIAAYIAVDGEIDPAPFLRWAARRGCTIWLPVIDRRHQVSRLGMHFARAPSLQLPDQRAGWKRNPFGIREPRTRQRMAPQRLDLLLMPLVGFDHSGQRLGMGGGYYDRLLADLARRARRPRQIGLAHASQQVESLPVAAWDQAVDLIVTVRCAD